MGAEKLPVLLLTELFKKNGGLGGLAAPAAPGAVKKIKII